MSDKKTSTPIETSLTSNTYVGNDVNTDGSSFIGRDKTVHGNEIGQDKVGGHKIAANIVNIHYGTNPPETKDGESQVPGAPPYQGLHFFDVKDAERFFVARP